MFAEYDDSEIGALDHEDIDGCIKQGSTVLNNILAEFQKEQEKK